MGEKVEVYSGNYVRVTEEQRGNHTYERAYIRSGVTVFPIIDPDHIRFIHQVSWDDGQTHLKPVTGYIDDSQTPQDCAIAELRQELKLQTNHWQLISQYDSDEPTVRKTQYFFAAFFLGPAEEEPQDPDEQILEHVDLDIYTLRRRIMDGEFGPTPTAFVLLNLIQSLEQHG